MNASTVERRSVPTAGRSHSPPTTLATRRRPPRPTRIAGALREQVLQRSAPPRRGARPVRRHRFQRVGGAVRRGARRRRTCSRILMPEKDSDPRQPAARPPASPRRSASSTSSRTSRRCSTAAGCYERRDDFIRKLVPEFGPGWGCKVVIANALQGEGYNLTMLVVQSPDGEQQKLRMPLDVYLGIVAATNMKQRTRKQIEYYHADRLNYAVIGTPNRLEYDQGFFVKNGDGAADVKPIAHLYKTPGLSARRASRRAGGDPPPAADHRHLVAGADAGGVLLLAALSRDGPLPLRPRTTASRPTTSRAAAGLTPSRSSGSGATSPPSAAPRAICTSRRCWSRRCAEEFRRALSTTEKAAP